MRAPSITVPAEIASRQKDRLPLSTPESFPTLSLTMLTERAPCFRASRSTQFRTASASESSCTRGYYIIGAPGQVTADEWG